MLRKSVMCWKLWVLHGLLPAEIQQAGAVRRGLIVEDGASLKMANST
jgi:hypothetical protein